MGERQKTMFERSSSVSLIKYKTFSRHLNGVDCTLYTVYGTVHYTLYTVHGTLCAVHCMSCQCTLYAVCYTPCTVHCELCNFLQMVLLFSGTSAEESFCKTIDFLWSYLLFMVVNCLIYSNSLISSRHEIIRKFARVRQSHTITRS